jgi:hypothetical protein
MSDNYYQLSTYADYIYIDEKIVEIHHEKYRFECGHFYEPQEPMPLIATEYGEKYSCQMIFSIGVDFIWNELIDIFQPYIEQEATLTKLQQDSLYYIEIGKIVWPKKNVIQTRGNKESINFKCEKCGRRIYFPHGKEYVMKKDISNLPFIITNSGFVFNSTIYERIISAPKWKSIKRKLYLKPIEVRDFSKDGFPQNLDDTDPKDERYFPL